VQVYHATFCINSLADVRGRRRYVTADDSCNNWLLAVFTMGEDWHNNHVVGDRSNILHPQGAVVVWSGTGSFGLVRDLKTPPLEVRRNQHRRSSRIIERAAAQLAGSFDLEAMVNAIVAFAGPDLSAIQEKRAKAQSRAADVFAGFYLPQLPTRHDTPRRWTSSLAGPCRAARHHRRAAQRDGSCTLADVWTFTARTSGRSPCEFRVIKAKLTRQSENHCWLSDT